MRLLPQSKIPIKSKMYLITLSARASTSGGIVRPICFAVLRLITNSNLVGCSTGSRRAWHLSTHPPELITTDDVTP